MMLPGVNSLPDFKHQFVSASLIRVDKEYPFCASSLKRGISLLREILEWMCNDFCAGVKRKLLRLIGAQSVKNNPHVCPGNSLKARRNVPFLVVSEDDC
jgi:hypothetical protein